MTDIQKTLAYRRGSLRVMRVRRALASVPPRPSVLPPGAGNEAKKAIKPQKRAKKREDRYVGERVRLDGHMDAATVRRHHDGDHPAILPIELAQAGLQHAAFRPVGRAVRAV